MGKEFINKVEILKGIDFSIYGHLFADKNITTIVKGIAKNIIP